MSLNDLDTDLDLVQDLQRPLVAIFGVHRDGG
jgi:hypothetical protein